MSGRACCRRGAPAGDGWAWRVAVRAAVRRDTPAGGPAAVIAETFGLPRTHVETLYDNLEVCINPGQIVAVVGPSGAGKSVLLRQVARRVRSARWIDPLALRRVPVPAICSLPCGSLAERLEALSLCGLAEAAVMVTPTMRLSGGQAYRLAVACALVQARQTARPALVIADEFAAMLDDASAAALCTAIRRLIGSPAGRGLALLVGTARTDLLRHLRPDQVIFKGLGEPAERWRWRRALAAAGTAPTVSRPRGWRIVRGSLHDYRRLARFHYLAGPPAAHKRVYVVRPGRGAGVSRRFRPVAGVLVISPPLLGVRGRNIATGGRYACRGPAAIARLNAEVEAISRVIVHPSYRGLGLAGRMVRHALVNAQTPVVETLAVMGRIHPLFDRAGMAAYHVPAPRHRPYVYYFWIAPRGHRAYRCPPDIAKRRLRKRPAPGRARG